MGDEVLNLGERHLCVQCQKPYRRRARHQKLCSDVCRRAWWKKLQATELDLPKMCSGERGAFNEMVACIELMKRGWTVFRAISPTASCDLIALKRTSSIRVEVRSGMKRNGGGVYYARPAKDQGRQDHYAVVVGTDVVFIPKLPYEEEEEGTYGGEAATR